MSTTFASVIGIGAPPLVRECESPQGQPPAPYAADLRIDGWLVQPELNLLTRDDTRVRVRAQLMDLLVCLASRPGKVFPKDELVAEVWEGRWIAGSALSRCVAELRSALGDDAQRPHVIETIIKRGYRLIAPVELVAAPRAVPPAAATASADPGEGSDPADTPRSFWQRLKLPVRRPA